MTDIVFAGLFRVFPDGDVIQNVVAVSVRTVVVVHVELCWATSSMLAALLRMWVFVSDVINSGLSEVITPRLLFVWK